jgi:hypothetical protein
MPGKALLFPAATNYLEGTHQGAFFIASAMNKKAELDEQARPARQSRPHAG